jgi:hypothetical protein
MAFTGIWVSRLKLISRAYPVPLLACMDCGIRAARRALPQLKLPSEAVMRIGSIVLIVWLIIGVIAGAQRHYFGGSNPNCAQTGTITATILAGPLNYVGVNPKVSCKALQPSR